MSKGMSEPTDLENQTETSSPSGTELGPEALAARERMERDIVTVIQTVYDPEIPVDIYALGLIYEIDIRDAGEVYVKMTLTSPMCPVAETLPPEVETKVRGVVGVERVELDLVWDPPWSPEMMSESAKLELGF